MSGLTDAERTALLVPCDCGHIYGGLTADERHRLTTGARP